MTCYTCGDTTSTRRFGIPKTEAERTSTHLQRFGTTQLPPRGTGLRQNTVNTAGVPTEFVIFALGIAIGGFIGYTIAKPAVTAGKIREMRAAYRG